MHQPTRFGQYLLLKKLGEDLFGDIYRAGRVLDDSVGELFLLRIFGGSLQADRLLRGFEEDTPIAEGPGVVRAAEKGDVEGVPWVAFPYASGRDLASLARQANEGFSSLETKIAVLIAERIAKGLAVVHQTEEPGRRSHHGLLVPQMIWVTSEGETYLTGSEIGPTALEMVRGPSGFGTELHRYLSPEVRSGGAPEAVDDVYSLGAILFELLTGEAVPADASAQLPTLLAGARLIEDTAPLPAGLRTLLERSLSPAAGRTPRADAWHRQLSGWMADSGMRATNFDLAFFMTDLYRNDLKREEEEVAQERKIDLSRKTVAAPPPAETEPAAAPQVSEPPEETYDVEADAPTKKSPLPLVAAAVVVTLLAIGGFFLFRDSEGPTPAAEPASQTAPTDATTAQALDLEAATAELDKLMEEQTKSVSSKISEEYEQQIAQLQSQLEAARVAEQDALRAARKTPEPPPAETARPEPVSPPAAEKPADESAAAETGPQAEEPAAGSPKPTEPEETGAGAEAAESPPAPRPVPNRPKPTPDRAAPVPPPPQQAVVLPPKRLSVPKPVHPIAARRAGEEATVIVKVLVGKDGKVLDAQLVQDKGHSYGFDDAALKAAEDARYEPATRDGKPIEMWTTLVLSFKLDSP